MKFRYIVLFVFLFAVFFLTFWYKEGLVKGMAEPGAPFLLPENSFDSMSFTWIKDDLGQVVLSRNTMLPIIAIAKTISAVTFPFFGQAFIFFVIFFLSSLFLFFYLKMLDANNFISIKKSYLIYGLIILFYQTNPVAISIWSRFQLPVIFLYAFIPVTLFFLEKFVIENNKKNSALASFCWLLASILFSASFENPAFIVTFWMFLFIYFILSLLIRKNGDMAYRGFKFIVFFAIWLSGNAWFLLPNLYFGGTAGLTGFNISFNLNTYISVSEQYGKLSNLLVGIISWTEKNLWHLNINWILIKFLLFLSLCLFLIGFIYSKKDRLMTFFLSLFAVLLFFSSGLSAGGLGEINKLLFLNVPLYQIMRNPVEKIGIYLSVSISVLFFLLFLNLHKKTKIFLLLYFILAASLVQLNFYFIKGTILSVSPKISQILSRGLDIKPNKEYYDFNTESKLEKLDQRYGILPMNGRLEMATYNWEKGYNGRELFNTFSAKPAVASVTWFALPDKIIRQLYLSENCSVFNKTLKMAGVKNNYYFKDVDQKELIDQNISVRDKIECIDKLEKWSCNSTYCKIAYDSNEFIAHFYIPQNSIVSRRNVEDFPKIISSGDWQNRSAVFFAKQNEKKENILEKIQSNNKTLPILEFKKINPTKYRVRAHGALEIFPLVFSESFHNGWKTYLNQNENLIRRGEQNDNLKLKIDNYKILDGNSEDQANTDELQDYINNSFVTTTGDLREKTIEHKKWTNGKEKLDYIEKYNIDFISKNFNGTIQNDNLPDGNIWETWFQKTIGNNDNHLIANGYANSWVIDADKICGNSTSPQPSPYQGEGDNKCVKNPDGSYDFEIVVEFWPQRLFYLGLGISGMTLLSCLLYLIWDWKKRQKTVTID